VAACPWRYLNRARASVASATLGSRRFDVDLVVGVFTADVDDVFAVECLITIERVVRPKPVGIDDYRIFHAVSKKESNRQFVVRFHCDHVLLSSFSPREKEYGWLVVIE
jgi:hypothetical protein